MSAPAYEKTWLFNLDNLVPATDAVTEKKTAWLGIVNGLIGAASNPMTVRGSSNGVAFGMDATNRWSTIADLIVGSWIVLRDAAINAKFEIALRVVTASGGTLNMEVAYSYLAGFGSVNGGTDGNATTRPTATDQQQLNASYDLTGNTGSKALRWYLWRSTDGTQCRVLVRNVTDSVWRMHLAWGKPKNPADLWVNTYWACMITAGIGSPDASGTVFRAHKAGTQLQLSSFCPADGGNPEIVNQPDDWRADAPLLVPEIHFGCQTVGSKSADMGSMIDAYAAPSVMIQAEAAPATGTKTWACYVASGTGWLFPHNNTTLKFGTAP